MASYSYVKAGVYSYFFVRFYNLPDCLAKGIMSRCRLALNIKVCSGNSNVWHASQTHFYSAKWN